MARFIARQRASHWEWNGGSFGSGCTGPKPSMPPMSWIPFMASLAHWLIGTPRETGADHGVTANQRCEPILAPALGASGPHRQHHEARLGGRIPYTDLGVRRQRDAEVGKHAARIDYRARAIGRRFVPGRRQAHHLPRIAGAERAHDHVVLFRRVLDCDKVIADTAGETERPDRRGGVLEQRLLEGRIHPGFRDDLGAVVWTDPRFIRLNDGVERGRIDVAFL